MRRLSICLLALGIIWAFVVGLIYLTLSSLAEPISAIRVLLYFGALLLGPLLLIVGPIFVLSESNLRLGAGMSGLGCFILTVLVVYESIEALHTEPLQAPPPYSVYGAVLLLTLLADVGAIQLYRVVSK